MYYITNHHSQYSISDHGMFLLSILVLWELVWKGFALWRASRNNDKAWFIALLIVQSAGILEIFYLFAFSKRPSILKQTNKNS